MSRDVASPARRAIRTRGQRAARPANRVRVTGQLIDAANGNHLWAEKYDRELADIFALQDDITNRVIGSVAPQILVAEAARVQRKPPQSMDAWDLVMQAVPHMWRMSTARTCASTGVAAAGHRARRQLCPCARSVGMDLCDHVQSGHAQADRRVHGQGARDAAQPPPRSMMKSPGPISCSDSVMRDGGVPSSPFGISSKSVELSPSFALGYAGLGYAWRAAANRKADCRRWRKRTG